MKTVWILRQFNAVLLRMLPALALAAIFCVATYAQDIPPETPSPPQQRPRATHTPPVRVTNLVPSSTVPPVAYKVVYTLSQMDGRRTVSTRKFEVSAETGGPLSHIRVGRRVMLNGTSQQLGTLIDVQLIAKPEGVELQTVVEQSDLAPQTAGHTESEIRESRLQTATLMPEGQSITLGGIDDLASTRHYEIAAVLTRQR
jgi:hypothetical protein